MISHDPESGVAGTGAAWGGTGSGRRRAGAFLGLAALCLAAALAAAERDLIPNGGFFPPKPPEIKLGASGFLVGQV